MSGFFKSKKKMIFTMSFVVLAITAMSAGMAFFLANDGLDFLPEVDFNFIGGLFSSGEDAQPEPVEETPEEEEGEAEEEAPLEEIVELPVSFNTPGEMRGVFLVPGVDYLTGTDNSQETVTAQINAALDSAWNLSMNTVIIDTVYGGQVVYHTSGGNPVNSSFDIMAYIVDKCREKGLYTYAVFDASHFVGRGGDAAAALAVNSGTLDAFCQNLREFADKYQLDGILLDGYHNRQQGSSYSVYLASGGAMGYEGYMRGSPQAVMRAANQVIRKYARNTQVGLLADAVWANADEDESGSNTRAAFTSLVDGNADTKAFVEEDLVDFVAVKAYGSITDTAEPFGEVVSWWSQVVAEHGIAMYVVHASDKACTEEQGWEAHDQLTRQIIEVEFLSGYRGSVFNNLARLVENPKESTSTMLKYFNNEVEAEHILTELEITRPEQATYTTFEPTVNFAGASDPNSPVLINGEEISTDDNGYFTVTIDLKAGLNSFTIEHKEKTLQYNITRQIQILKSMSPRENIIAEGGMTITITANAYENAVVYAVVNGTNIPMQIDDTAEDEVDRESNYKMFVGEYTAPGATEVEQNLGSIVVYASWEGMQDTLQGGSIKVNKRAKLEDGVAVIVTADQARTYPPNTLNNIPNANYYPLPKGAMDYAVGEELVYKKDGVTYSYFVLASGMRVQSKDIRVAEDYPGDNIISAMSVEADSSFTYVTLKMSQQVAYTFSYAADGVSIEFHYTNAVPGGLELDKNPIFSKAGWSGTTLKLTFIKQGGFTGYKGYFDSNGNLVFRFRNPPSSISGARIAIDPGHGGNDPGASGFLANYPEKVINKAIAEALRDELKSRGASVAIIDNSNNPSLEARVAMAEDWGADYFISVHNNSATNSSAVGTEVYYFYPFSRTLATNASANVASQFATTNRGSKQSYYTVTLSSQMTSVLVECGFLSNKGEYEKLLKVKGQKRIAAGIADGIAAAIKSARTGSAATGVQSVGGSVSAGTAAVTDDDEEPTEQQGLTLNKTALELEVGSSYYLEVEEDVTVTWSSSSSSTVRVDSDGEIHAIKTGTARITATASDGESATCTVTVVAEEDHARGAALEDASDVYVEKDVATISEGREYTIQISSDIGTVRPTDFIWESSDESIATVDRYGVVTTKKEGDVDIVVESKDGEYGFLVTLKVR